LPYQAQGAAIAVEDGGIIGNLIGRLNHELLNGVIPQSRRRESINAALGLYEQSQKNRTTVNVKGAISNRAFFHLPDSSEQEDRDEELANHTFTNKESGYMWCDMPYNRQLLDADVICDASERFDGWLGKNF
jgi:salicylate hydroxylase